MVAPKRWPCGEVRWRSATTDRDLRDMPHGALIREALERVQVAAPPRAIALPERGRP